MKQSIFNYSDYRSYLRDHALEQKRRDPNWSYGRWAKKLKLANTAVIANILNGVRNPGQRVLKELVSYFSFAQNEAEYFKNLVYFAKKQTDPELVQLLIAKLQETHPTHDFHLVEDKFFQAIARPHYYAIRELVNLADFQEDAGWIQNRLRIKVAKPEIKRAIQNLLNTGLLEKSVSGKLKYHSGSMRSSNDIASEALRQFHEEMIGLAQNAIRQVPVLERDITGVTFSIKKDRLTEIKNEITRFRRELMKKYEDLGGGEDVYQLGIQFFPLTINLSKKNWGEKND